MKQSAFLIIFLVFLFAQCGLINNKNQKEEGTPIPKTIKTPEEILAEEKLRNDSIENAALELIQKTAFGEITFGMEKEQVEAKNEKRQLLGKNNYNFSYSFNKEDQLYKLKIKSDGVKTIQFDTSLKSNYHNLLQIIKTKYGAPKTNLKYPSIFDVQKRKKLQLNKWEAGTKQIVLGLQENGLNSYSVFCDIGDTNMLEAESIRLQNLKNKDVIKASEKF